MGWVLLMVAGERPLSLGLYKQKVNFLNVFIASTHSISYQTRPSGPRLMGSLRLCAQAHGEALQWVRVWVGLAFELRKCYLEL